MSRIARDGVTIGGGARCFVIAEAGVNHNGDVALAHRLVDVAADAGADAVKFQTFRAERLATRHAPKAAYQERSSSGASQQEMLRALELDEAAHRALAKHARERGITFLSTPFDAESVDLLDALGVPVFKVPSGELTNLPLLAHIAAKQKPMLVSTGMATLDEVSEALDVIGDVDVALLHCVSRYPAPASEANLRAMATMAERFRVPVGYSDHTRGIAVALAAVALGAAVVEKHFTVDRDLPGPDHAASLEPTELAALVDGIRTVESALGDGEKRPTVGELEIARVARRSVVFARALPAGHRLGRDDVTLLRPGTGLMPRELPRVLGRTLTRGVDEGELVSLEVLT